MNKILIAFFSILVSFECSAEVLAECQSAGGASTIVRLAQTERSTTTTIDQADTSWMWDISIQEKSVLVNEYVDDSASVDFEPSTSSFEILSRDSKAIYAFQSPESDGLPNSGRVIFIDLQAKVVFSAIYSSADLAKGNPFNAALSHVFTCKNRL